MVIDITDPVLHSFPEGWSLILDPLYIDDMEVWVLGKEAQEVRSA